MHPPPEMTCSFLIQLVFCQKKKTTWFISVEVEKETSAPPPKKYPGSAPEQEDLRLVSILTGRYEKLHSSSICVLHLPKQSIRLV